ncbi:hypothetical protein ACET3Z_028931 [Daucus carota]
MKTGTSNGNSANQENVKVDVEVEPKDLPPMPPGFHFVQSSAVLILEYLVKKIVGVPLASDLVKVRDGVQVLDPEEHRFGFDYIALDVNELVDLSEIMKKMLRQESKDLPPMPPGFHFVPSSAVLILEYLVKKIVGVPLASDLVKVRDGVQNGDSLFRNASHFLQLKCTQVPAQGGAAKRTAAPLLTRSTKSRGSWWKIAARSTDLVTQQHQLRGVSSVIGDIRDPTIMLLFGHTRK